MTRICTDIMAREDSEFEIKFSKFDGFTVFKIVVDGNDTNVYLEANQVQNFKNELAKALDLAPAIN